MFRSLSLAIGITLCILGLEFMVVDKVVMADDNRSATATNSTFGGSLSSVTRSGREYEPPEWMPWSLMSAGAIIIIYSFTIPRRVAG